LLSIFLNRDLPDWSWWRVAMGGVPFLAETNGLIAQLEVTVCDVLRQLLRSPGDPLIRRWNGKSAVFSSIIRAGIAFACTLRAGWSAAVGAMLAEFTYRAVTAALVVVDFLQGQSGPQHLHMDTLFNKMRSMSENQLGSLVSTPN
jgi:hypothetical protein